MGDRNILNGGQGTWRPAVANNPQDEDEFNRKQAALNQLNGGGNPNKQYNMGTYDSNRVFTSNVDPTGYVNKDLGRETNNIQIAADKAAAQPIRQAQAGQIDTGSTAAGSNAFNSDRANAADDRSRQMSLADILNASARGQGPSAAQLQLQQATDQNMANAMSIARSGNGDPSVALKDALMQQGAAGQQAANQSAQLRLQEQTQARGQLADVLNASRSADVSQQGQSLGLRGQDLSAATSQAGLNTQTNIANMTSGAQQDQAKNDLAKQYMAMGLTLEQAQFQAQQDYERARVADLQNQYATSEHVSEVQQQAGTQAAGATAAALGALGAAAISDKRAKKNIVDGEDASIKLLRQLRPQMFEYKDPADGTGPRLGVMAQDVEKGAPALVSVGTDGKKRVNVAEALMASLAAMGTLNKRVEDLESVKNSKGKGATGYGRALDASRKASMG